MKAKIEEQIAIDIDYETFTTEEIVKIFDFFNLITLFVKGGKVKKSELIEAYHEYKQSFFHTQHSLNDRKTHRQ